jgi:hypothetical protein
MSGFWLSPVRAIIYRLDSIDVLEMVKPGPVAGNN